MINKKWLQTLAGMVTSVIVLTVLYFIPPIHERLSWRVDFASAYTRSLFSPIGTLPTALPIQMETATQTPPMAMLTATPTPIVSPTKVPPTPTPTAIPSSTILQPPVYEKQGPNNCGPATLSGYLRFYGWKGDQKTIADVLKTDEGDRNINVEELVYFVRNYAGWLNIEFRVGGTIPILKSLIANGVPVMVEKSSKMDKKYWPSDDLWAGHYLFITGYDDSIQSFTVQDTVFGPDLVVSYSELENNWQSFNHVYVMIYPPEKEDSVKSILGDEWDVDINRQNALDDATEATKNDPSNTYNWFNLGTNLVYFERYGEAAIAFDKARQIGFPQRMLRYQFGPFIAYFNSLRTDDLLTLAKYALNITPSSEEAHLWYGWALYRQGDKETAITEFRKALDLNNNYIDAQYALDYAQNN